MNDCDCELQGIYDTYHPQILRYLAARVGMDEAQDLAQEVFIKAGLALSDFRGEASLSTWLYRIAHNLAADRLRSPSFRRQDSSNPGALDEAHQSIDYSPGKPVGVEGRVVSHEMSACIWRYMDRLSESYRTVLVLSDMEGLSDEDIARKLGITLGAVKIRLHRARHTLRELFLDGCEYYWMSELSWRAF